METQQQQQPEKGEIETELPVQQIEVGETAQQVRIDLVLVIPTE